LRHYYQTLFITETLHDRKFAETILKFIKSDLEASELNFGNNVSGYYTVVPIIASSDSLGLVIIISDKKNDYSSLGKLLAKIIADKIDIF
jgi:hypothetical protein